MKKLNFIIISKQKDFKKNIEKFEKEFEKDIDKKSK